MDHIDRTILNHLQRSGRATYNELSESTHLTIPAVRDRIVKLRERGVIKRFSAIVDSKKVERDVTAFIHVFTLSSRNFQDILSEVEHTEEVQECYSITGSGTYILKIRTFSMSTLENLLREIQSWPGVMRTESNVVLTTFKEETFINAEDINPTEESKED